MKGNLRVINKTEYLQNYSYVLEENRYFYNSPTYIEYALKTKRYNDCIFLIFTIDSVDILIYHVFIRKPYHLGATSYHEPLYIDSSLNDKYSKKEINLLFIKKLKLFLFKKLIIRYSIEFASLDYTVLIKNDSIIFRVMVQNTPVLVFDYSKSYDYSYNRSLKRVLKNFNYDLIKIDSGNTFDIYSRFVNKYAEFENENSRIRRTKAIEEIKYEYSILPKKNCKFFILYLDNEAISLLAVYIYSGVWTEFNSSTKKIAFQKNIPASHILHDYIIREAFSENAIMFDLAGLNGETKDSKKKNIDMFKLKFTRNVMESRRIKLYYPYF